MSQVAFIHIPKTGGTYIGQSRCSEFNFPPPISPIVYYNHVMVVRDAQNGPPLWMKKTPNDYRFIPKSALNNMFVFSIVRHPFTWLVSGARHWRHIPPTKGEMPERSTVFAFAEWIKKLADTPHAEWPSSGLIFRQLWADDGEMVVDWLARNETLDDDLRELAQMQGLKYEQCPRVRVGETGNPWAYYDDRLADIVSIVWQREMVLFGYKPMDPKPHVEAAVIGKKVRSKNISYDINTDSITWKRG